MMEIKFGMYLGGLADKGWEVTMNTGVMTAAVRN